MVWISVTHPYHGYPFQRKPFMYDNEFRIRTDRDDNLSAHVRVNLFVLYTSLYEIVLEKGLFISHRFNIQRRKCLTKTKMIKCNMYL